VTGCGLEVSPISNVGRYLAMEFISPPNKNMVLLSRLTALNTK
jgi:hypothetical protein